MQTMGCTSLPILNSGVTGLNFTFLYDEARSSQMNFLKSEWQHRNLFYNAKATNENESADFANFDPKIGCYGNVP